MLLGFSEDFRFINGASLFTVMKNVLYNILTYWDLHKNIE